MALALAVGVLAQQEAHDDAVGAHVWRRDVELRAHQRLEPVHVAQRERFQLLAGERLRVHLDAALAAAEGDVGDGGLPGHLRGENFEQVERDVLVEPGAPLVGAARLVVLHAVRLEALRPAGDHLVEALALQPHDAVAHEHVGVDQRAPLEDEAAVDQRLEPVGEHLAVGKVLVPGLLGGGQGTEPRVQLHRDVEDVLVIRLFQLHPHAAVETDQVRRPVEDLHRLGVDGLPGWLGAGDARGHSSSVWERGRFLEWMARAVNPRRVTS